MLLILDGDLEHVAHAYWKKSNSSNRSNNNDCTQRAHLFWFCGQRISILVFYKLDPVPLKIKRIHGAVGKIPDPEIVDACDPGPADASATEGEV